MICIVALVVFGVLGIFSARYRLYARQAFDCVFRRITLRKCETSFDRKMKMKVVSKLSAKSAAAGRFVYRHFELISWFFTVLFFASLAFTLVVVYNMVTYGTCDPNSTSCIFEPDVPTCGSGHCVQEGCTCEQAGCEAPDYTACGGNCTCTHGVCSG